MNFSSNFSNMENSSIKHTLSETYFAILPEEIVIEVLSYVGFQDLCNFCDAYNGCENLLFKEKALSRKINMLQLSAHADINKYLLKFNPIHLTSLDINDCHWIPHEDLLNFIGNCVNLKSLSALATRLGLSDEDLEAYNKTKINKLALTFDGTTKITLKGKLPSVTNLALKKKCLLNELYEGLDAATVLNPMFPSLQKVWMNNAAGYDSLLDWLRSYNTPSRRLQKINISSGCIRNPELNELANLTDLYLYYVGRKENQKEVVACLENLSSKPEPKVLPYEWQLIETHHFEKPYGPKDAKRLYLNKAQLDTILFEELNFNHMVFSAEIALKRIEAYGKILCSPNARNVTKLAFCNCLFDVPKQNCDSSESSNVCDRVLSLFKEIRRLEISKCLHDGSLANAYKAIPKYAQLRHLYVELQDDNDGQFLLDVFRECTQLETIWIYAFWHECNYEKVNYHVLKGLESVTKLREFTFENYRLKIDDLLTVLIGLKRIKLQKIFFRCQDTIRYEDASGQITDNSDVSLLECPAHFKHFNINLLSEYLRTNPQLRHCAIHMANLIKTEEIFLDKVVKRLSVPHRYLNLCRRSLRNFKSFVCSLTLREDFEHF